MNKVTLRAITAYTRTDMKSSANASVSVRGIEKEWLGKAYVLLEDDASHQLMAVYRCMNRGELKRLKRWPQASPITHQQQQPTPSAKQCQPFWSCLLSKGLPKQRRLKRPKTNQSCELRTSNKPIFSMVRIEQKKAACAAFWVDHRGTCWPPR